MKKLGIPVLLMVLCSCSVEIPDPVSQAYEALPDEIDFNFHVKPILSDRCYKCHGPDEQARQADLRLDLPHEAARVIKASSIRRSPLVHRIISADPEEMMPPPDSNLKLTAEEKATLIKWIEQGAEWKDHWAFIPPQKPQVPTLSDSQVLAQNEIDHFIFQQASHQGLVPNPMASKERLLRRVTMDLTGLPPTMTQIKNFVEDQSPEAYEKVVDELLESSACAERLTMEWMDLARYADSHGLHADGWRMMWPWRDWVIKAFDENMPYDQFVTWQLAGDLLDNATREQKLATAFNRNHPMTAEGGAIDEEYRLSYVFDRAETAGTAFLGLTMNCARCHDHKFDPVSQKDYYQFAAFFNNIKELGMTGDDGNYGPMLALTDAETDKITAFLDQEIGREEQRRDTLTRNLKVASVPGQTTASPPKIVHLPLDQIRNQRRSDLRDPAKHKGPLKNQVIDNNARATSPGNPQLVPGKVGQSLHFTGEYDELYIHDVPNFEWTQAFSGGLWVNTTKRDSLKTQTLMGTAGEKNNFWRGWDFFLDSQNRLNFRLIHSLPHNYIHVSTLDSVKLSTWAHAFFTYDGSGKAGGIKLYIDGRDQNLDIGYDRLYKSAKTVGLGAHELIDRPVRVAKSYRSYTGENGVLKGELDEIYLFGSSLTTLEVHQLYNSQSLQERQTTSDHIQAHNLAHHPEIIDSDHQLKELRQRKLELMNAIPEVMVMEELPQTRAAFAYRRGAYDAPMYQVETGTPEILNQFPEGTPRNRLGLAKWLFSGDNPLTARVTVNRYWQMLFGQGLVSTPHDFGVQGALPTHPHLLDWLAVTLMEQQWDIKGLLKLMVMSHTYRQSSSTTEEKLRMDPQNIYLARGTTYRLSAEMIRDNALAASGLLVNKLGGESVRPYQPEGLWIEKGNFSHKLLHYRVTRGDSLYRRSLYTFVKRSSPHPAMTAFDAPNRDVCIVKRENTNTPLQALVLLNDPQFVECSRVLAQRVQQEARDSLEEQIGRAFQLATGRSPKDQEMQIFMNLFNTQKEHFRQEPEHAQELLKVGDYPVDPQLNPLNTAALTVLASTILNHDEAYMKR
ncbi:MAG: DUF1553 domain-containing protein [Cyclobacteriaceae bacterium]|nr:DUF1553 domain-containing protein [Cyclobacteriaceae bacterium]